MLGAPIDANGIAAIFAITLDVPAIMLKLPMLLFQWRQAQMMMEYACRQLAVAVQKWQDLPEIPSMSVPRRPPLS